MCFIGVPHVCYRDDVYKGYHIPKGSIVIGNIWRITSRAMGHNANVYKDPEIFNPDRFLDPSIPLPPTFGFGRRLCPGIYYAKSSLFIFIASILSVFNIEMVKDEQGNNVKPIAEGKNSIVYHPLPFKFSLKIRSPLHEQLIRAGA
ncbi:hypothetical protein FRC10_002240 [Ceratobasidium sp. 414]|nr:hypothetical protein FRC10_002240 [Ceratobasidium sp. 414]